MKCPKCQTQNDTDAGYCKCCGLNLNLQTMDNNETPVKGDVFIIVAIAIMVCNRIYWTIISSNYIWEAMKIPSIVVSIIMYSLPIIISFSIKQKVVKLVFAIIGILYFLLNTYQILFIENSI
jgi:hypothetical protein